MNDLQEYQEYLQRPKVPEDYVEVVSSDRLIRILTLVLETDSVQVAVSVKLPTAPS